MTEIVDVHSHMFRREVFEFINDETPATVPLRDGGMKLRWGYWGELSDTKARVELIEEGDIDHQVLSFSGIENFVDPKHWKRDPRVRARIARKINDDFATVVERHPDLFGAFADVPIPDADHVDLAVDEIRRAVVDLGLDGVTLNSNYAGIRLDDERLRPILETVDDLDIPILMHPANPAGKEAAMDDVFFLPVMVGYPNETALAAARLVLSGRLDEFDLDVIAPHAGGTLPYLAYRISLAFEKDFPSDRQNKHLSALDHVANYYFKRNFYYDTALSSGKQFQFVLDELGNQLVFGTDYPYHPSDKFDRIIDFIDQLETSPDEREKVFNGNQRELGLV